MQEGPHWYFQDYPLEKQIWYFNTIKNLILYLPIMNRIKNIMKD
jgi:hypothetical protein